MFDLLDERTFAWFHHVHGHDGYQVYIFDPNTGKHFPLNVRSLLIIIILSFKFYQLSKF